MISNLEQFASAGAKAQRDVDVVLEGFAKLKSIREQQHQAALAAGPFLSYLCGVMRAGTDQSCIVRSLLYSLWNGKPASLVDVVVLDWEIRQSLCAVILAFGYEGKEMKFYYDAIQEAVTAAGLWKWFLEERE